MDTLSKCYKGGHLQDKARIWLKKFLNILCRSFPVIRMQKKSKNYQIHQLLLKKSKLQESVQFLLKSYLSMHDRIKSIFNIETQIEDLDVQIVNIFCR